MLRIPVLKCLTSLSSLLTSAVDMVFELDANMSLVRLVANERMFQQLLCGGAIVVILHQAGFNKAEELLGPLENGNRSLERKAKSGLLKE